MTTPQKLIAVMEMLDTYMIGEREDGRVQR
jgi:hypothetical protein